MIEIGHVDYVAVYRGRDYEPVTLLCDLQEFSFKLGRVSLPKFNAANLASPRETIRPPSNRSETPSGNLGVTSILLYRCFFHFFSFTC